MSGFDWNAHPVVGAPQAQTPTAQAGGGFKWDDHPVVGQTQADSPGILETVANGVVKTGKAFDSVLGAPLRAGIGAAQDGNNPISAYAEQFAGDPDKAPTGKDIVKKAGLSDQRKLVMTAAQQKALDDQNNLTNAGVPNKPLSAYKDLYAWSPAELGGVAMDVAADPTLAIPAVGILKKTSLGAKAAEAISEGAKAAASGASSALKGTAEKLAVNATGATGKQATKFADNAGRELLDRGIVKFGDSQAKIADRAGGAVEAANSQIDSALSKLEAQGVKIDTTEVKRNLVDKVRELAADSSQHDVLKLINNEIKNITDAAQARGTADLGITAAEQTKRGYSKAAGNWMDPKAGQAGKEAYLAHMNAVEQAATAADPATAQLFKEGKQAHGLLAPIKEAAERRALVTGQHPAGGFLDMAASAVGEGAAGPGGAIAMPVARRLISPRITSTLAVTADKVGDVLARIPELKNLQAEQPALYQALVTHLAAPAEAAGLKVANTRQTGPDKWANDGYDKLIEHVSDNPEVQKVIEQSKASMLKDPKTKQILIQASDLKPGSPAMKSTMAKLKAKIASGDE